MGRLAIILHVAFCLIVLVTQTCFSSLWERKVLYRLKRQVECQIALQICFLLVLSMKPRGAFLSANANQFKCASGACIESYYVCDGTKDCVDGSDETEDICKQLGFNRCPTLSFQCAYGACIDGNKKCDGHVDCADGSDERAPACTNTMPQDIDSVSSSCKGNFKCKSGQCINQFSVCDGTVNCIDGSDETTEQCSSISCPGFSFRCSYGGCVDASARCDGIQDCADNSDEDPGVCLTKSPPNTTVTPITLPASRENCLLPKQPEFGSYTALACERTTNPAPSCMNIPGTIVPENWLLSFKCNDGYYIHGTHEDHVFVFCQHGNWSEKIPVCKKKCPSLISLSVEIKCWYGVEQTHGYVNCSKPMQPRTRARGHCKPLYEEIRRSPIREIFCKENGEWSNNLISCLPVCGKRNIKGASTPLILNGNSTKHGEFPWHTGLYMKNETNHWEQKCGGSLISPHIVLTAAHCVFSEMEKKKLSPTDVKVGLGKYYREWTHYEPYAEKSDVREIFIPSAYFGRATSYAQDIALLDLKYSVRINSYIMPVCVDWDHQVTITPGMRGTLVGWGRTENRTYSNELLNAELPYIEYGRCIFEVSSVFRHYVTADKFCAGFSDGASAAPGDSGGGLTFLLNDLYYVYGIVSTKVEDTTKSVAAFTFTNVTYTELLLWLDSVKNSLEEVHQET